MLAEDLGGKHAPYTALRTFQPPAYSTQGHSIKNHQDSRHRNDKDIRLANGNLDDPDHSISTWTLKQMS